jgi:hypothetical protein
MSTAMPLWHPLRTRTPAPRRSPYAFFVGAVGGALFAGLAGFGIGGGALLTAPAAVEPVSPAPLALASPSCQWSYDRHGVTIFGDQVQAFRVRFRGVGRVTVDVPNRPGRQWISVKPAHTAEDDTGRVEAKVAGTWRRCKTA